MPLGVRARFLPLSTGADFRRTGLTVANLFPSSDVDVSQIPDRSRGLWIAAALLAVASGFCWYVLSSKSQPEASHQSSTSEPSAQIPSPAPELSPDSVGQSTGDDESLESAKPVDEPERVALTMDPAEVELSGQVRTSDGIGIEEARISWTTWRPEFLRYVTSAVTIPVNELLASSVHTKSRADGTFAFTELPAGVTEQPSFIWFTHPEHFAQVIEIPAGEHERSAKRDVVLETAEGCVVLVHRGRDSVAGAVVDLQAAFPQDARSQFDQGEFAPKARLVFHRRYQTGADGSVRVARIEHRLALRAHEDEFESSPWVEHYKPRIDLHLHETFSVSGVVALPDEIDPTWGSGRIEIIRSRASLKELVCSVEVGSDGEFGPHVVPLQSADHYIARLAGNNFKPAEQDLGLPRQADEIFVSLEAEKGNIKWFQAIDMAGNAIPRASVFAQWYENGVYCEKRVEGRDDGYVTVLGMPDGFFTGRMCAEGYASQPFSQVHMPEDPLRVLACTMTRGYELRGRCVRGIDPVPDFELRYWTTKDTVFRNSQSCFGRVDGEFSLADLSSQEMSIVAIAPGYGRSEVVTVDLSERQDEEVILTIENPRTVKGHLVDARTREAIAGGSVTVYSNHVYTEMDPIGAPIVTDGAGYFEADRLTGGMNVLAFHAPGYSHRELKVIAKDAGAVDLGNIEISHSQPLSAKLRLPEDQDPSQWVLTATGVGAIPTTPFDSNGDIFLEEAGEGAWYFEVRDLRGTYDVLASQFYWLEAGEEWHIEFDLAGGRSLLIQTTSPTESIPGGLNAVIEYSNLGGGRQYVSVPIDEHGEARVPSGVGPGTVIVRTVANDSEVLISGSALRVVDETDDDQVVIPLELEPWQTRLRVRDPDGGPLQGVLVNLRSSQHPKLQLASGITDRHGGVVLGKLQSVVDRVDLTSPDGGLQHDIEVVLPDDSEHTLELVFDQSAKIQLRVVDGDTPQSEVTCRLWSQDATLILTSGQTPDSNGSLTFSDLSPGKYSLRVDGERHWPAWIEIEARAGDVEQTVQVRRVASLALTFASSDGTRLSNREVDLEHLDSGDHATTWIAGGLVSGFEERLLTDAAGFLELPRVPHGEYRWRVGGSTGVLRVAAADRLERTLAVQ